MNPIKLDPIPPAIQSTPWGAAQDAFQYAEGLIFVHTVGHGGFWCGPERWLKIRATWPDWQPFNNNERWLEEDLDAAIAPLAFPELFNDQAVFNAVRTLRGPGIDRGDRGWRQVATWLHFTEAGSAVHARFYRFKESIADLWERGGLSGGGGRPGWDVNLYRGEACVVMTFREYPQKQFYTDAEIESLAMTAEERAAARPIQQIPVEFDESQCGGAFDGFRVTSDADPGL